jgi:hypothetical protein
MTEINKMLPRLLTEDEVRAITHDSKSKLAQDRVRGNGIPFVKLGSKVFYRESDVLAFIEQRVFRSTAEVVERGLMKPRRNGEPIAA